MVAILDGVKTYHANVLIITYVCFRNLILIRHEIRYIIIP